MLRRFLFVGNVGVLEDALGLSVRCFCCGVRASFSVVFIYSINVPRKNVSSYLYLVFRCLVVVLVECYIRMYRQSVLRWTKPCVRSLAPHL